MSQKIRNAVLCALLGSASQSALAQTVPNAGDTLRQLQTAPPTPPKANPDIDLHAPLPNATAPGGLKVTVTSVHLQGNQSISTDQLTPLLGNPVGQSYDMAGLKVLTDRITAYYRARGYPFARAIVPAQDMKDGNLLIYVVEGRYGKVTASASEPGVAEAAQPFLDGLRSGDIITAGQLERHVLILNDLPGYSVTPIMRPGQDFGTGDLIVNVKPDKDYMVGLFVDNEGNRYTGESRVRLTAEFDSPFMFGDQLSLQGLYSEENLFLGSAAYSVPLGSSGLRATAGYAQTAYQIGREFSSLAADGTAGVASLAFSYPLLRSQMANLSLGVSYQHKALHDRQANGAFDNARQSDIFPVTAQFDFRDAFIGGAVTYGALSYTPGRLGIDSALEAVNRANGVYDSGYFGKFNFDAARLQTLFNNISVYSRVSAQWGNNQNLDSSESFILGGANGVRAYPLGEGTGDKGWLGQFELRANFDGFAPFAFYDLGSTSTKSYLASVRSYARSLAGAGVGLRANIENWSLETSLAWKTAGGKPQSDPRAGDPQGWVSLGYQF